VTRSAAPREAPAPELAPDRQAPLDEREPDGVTCVSQDLSVKFLRAITASTGPLQCEGTVLHLGSRTALATANVTDGTGKLYAHATSSCLILRP
jgi:uncharacterized protein (TIGR00369 family)